MGVAATQDSIFDWREVGAQANGHNEQLRRIAQEIIIEQQQEIAAMRLALGQPLPASTVAPDQPSNLVMPTMNVQKSPK